MVRKSDKTKPQNPKAGSEGNPKTGPGGDEVAAQGSAQETVSKLAETAQGLVATARDKASAVAGETLDTTREGLKKAWEQTAEFAGEQTKKAQEALGNVDVDKSAKATMAAGREAVQSMEKTAGELTEKLKDFTKRHESDTVSGSLAEERQMRLGYAAYLLYGLAPVTLVSGLFGVILCYVRLGDEAIVGTVLRSHFRWLILTFWIATGGLVLAALSAWAAGRFVGSLVLLVTLVWFAFRVVKGWLSLYDGKKIATPNALW